MTGTLTERNRAKKQKRKIPMADRLAALNDPDRRDDFCKAHGIANPADEIRRLEKLRARVMNTTCSEAWFRANWVRGEAFPPGGDQSLMVPCKGYRCEGKVYPPNFISSRGYCQDCVYCMMSKSQLKRIPPGTSFINMAKVKTAIKRGKQPTE